MNIYKGSNGCGCNSGCDCDCGCEPCCCYTIGQGPQGPQGAQGVQAVSYTHLIGIRVAETAAFRLLLIESADDPDPFQRFQKKLIEPVQFLPEFYGIAGSKQNDNATPHQ